MHKLVLTCGAVHFIFSSCFSLLEVLIEKFCPKKGPCKISDLTSAKVDLRKLILTYRET